MIELEDGVERRVEAARDVVRERSDEVPERPHANKKIEIMIPLSTYYQLDLGMCINVSHSLSLVEILPGCPLREHLDVLCHVERDLGVGGHELGDDVEVGQRWVSGEVAVRRGGEDQSD